jgi:hypothetical protein
MANILVISTHPDEETLVMTTLLDRSLSLESIATKEAEEICKIH